MIDRDRQLRHIGCDLGLFQSTINGVFAHFLLLSGNSVDEAWPIVSQGYPNCCASLFGCEKKLMGFREYP